MDVLQKEIAFKNTEDSSYKTWKVIYQSNDTDEELLQLGETVSFHQRY